MDYVLMTKTHVPQVAALEALCFSMPWSERSIGNELTNPLSLWLVAVEGDVVVGYAGSQTVLGEADMMNIAVLPEYRKRGIGRQLLNALIVRLRTNAVHSLTLEVRTSNHEALKMYASLGFIQVGRRPGYYSAPKEDALILRKEWEV